MTVRELYTEMNNRIPRSLSCDWDNDGLACCPDPDAPVRGILIALDPTEDVVELAIESGCNVILTHHPLLFRGLKTVDGHETNSRKIIRMIGAGIAAMSFHTRLDALDGGVNDALVAALGLIDPVTYGTGANAADMPMGRMGHLRTPMSLDDFACYAADRLSIPSTLGLPREEHGTRIVCSGLGHEAYADVIIRDFTEHLTPARPSIRYADCGRPVRLVAVLGGAGGDEIAAAVAAGADTFVTGELGYHQLCDAPYGEINLVEAGHFFTEFPVCRCLCCMAAVITRRSIPIHLVGGTRVQSV